MPSIELIKAVAVTAELCGRTFSETAAGVFCADLTPYPLSDVLNALQRCRKEVRGVLTTQDVISRIDDGRPGVEEAWASIPADESVTVIWTAEAQDAYAVCAPVLATGDRVAARMAFKEVYQRLLLTARDAGGPIKWAISLGHDVEQRKRVLAAGVVAFQVSAEQAYELCPLLPAPASLLLAAPPKNEREEARAKRLMSALAEAKRDPLRQVDPMAWAKALRDAEQSGSVLSEAQRAMWRQAIDRRPTDGPTGAFTPIPINALPPGMRRGVP